MQIVEPQTGVGEIMREFSRLTGLEPAGAAPRRYLWTDAFAVCNFLGLYRTMGREECRRRALRLVDQVHAVLGHHRRGDPRSGWLSGLSEEEGAKHPAAGGLRIGKTLPERGPSEPVSEHLEWDRDGQYFHYLTKWMHALTLVSRVTGDAVYNDWALELAGTAYSAFVHQPPAGGRKRMYWKMSVDLSRPLVHAMGHHDPLDGMITFFQIRSTAKIIGGADSGQALAKGITDFSAMCRGQKWTTSDPLGIGGLLIDAARAGQLLTEGCTELADLPARLLAEAEVGLEAFLRNDPLRLPSKYRLAFRELGLVIGLKAVPLMKELFERHWEIVEPRQPVISTLEQFDQWMPLAERIIGFWLDQADRSMESWTGHREINMVMLGTALSPQGFLEIPGPGEL